MNRRNQLLVWSLIGVIGIGVGVGFRESLAIDWLHFLHGEKRLTPGGPVPFKKGDALAAIKVANREVAYGADEKPRVFFFFSSDCPFCTDQLPMWRGLADALNSEDVELLGLGIEGRDQDIETEYMSNAGLGRVELLFLDGPTMEMYRLYNTPTTLAVDKNGKVERMWVGTWDSSDVEEVETLFGISLVGILPLGPKGTTSANARHP